MPDDIKARYAAAQAYIRAVHKMDEAPKEPARKAPAFNVLAFVIAFNVAFATVMALSLND